MTTMTMLSLSGIQSFTSMCIGRTMAKALTIKQSGSWLNQFPPTQRKAILKQVFKLADQMEYDIRMEGQRWPNSTPTHSTSSK